jgi:hypothetical protein
MKFSEATTAGDSALRNFNPADVACGSFTSDQDTPDFACMSALPPIATKLVRRNEVTLCANKGHMHRSE